MRPTEDTVRTILLSPPDLTGTEQASLERALESGWIAPLGPEVDAFETELAAVAGVHGALATSSGTAALHLALRVLDVESTDVVVCSTFTFIGSTAPIRYCGAEPVLIDSDAETWNMDPNRLRAGLADLAAAGVRPKAAIVVDLFGQSADYDPITQVCDEFGVPIIEDAAEALGATYRDRPAGSFGRLGMLSFNGNKIVTTSGGGALLSDDEALLERARYLGNQARDPAPHYQHSEVGYNYRLSNLLAAVGRAQLAHLSDRVETKRAIFGRYEEGLGDLPGFDFMPEASYGRATRWLTTLTIDPGQAGFTRDELLARLNAASIEARPVWKPMHLQPTFENCTAYGGDVSEHLFNHGLCLPSGTGLSLDDQQRVIQEIRRHAKQ
jgi:pyridoxal phosphate-dependent aminotransferase EpsN